MVKREIVLLLLSLLLLIATCYGVNEYDYLQVVMQWQPATCNDNTKPYPYCHQTPQPKFSIHGMWPSLYHGYTRCYGSPYDASQLSVLLPGLEDIWGNVVTGDNEWLWEHEWNKHGTCTEHTLFKQQDYFIFSAKMFLYYNPETILRNWGISPDGGYFSIQEIYTAIRTVTGKLPAVRCNYNHGTGLQQLHEISLCIKWDDSGFEDCPLNANKCYGDYLVWYS